MHTRPHGTVTRYPAAQEAIGLQSSTTSAEEHRMPLNGGAISYTKSGTGPVLLLLHDLGSSRGTWQHLIPGLARTHTVIAPDLPGHGLSDPPAGDYSLGAHACAMRDLLLSLGHSRANIVGHSLGGGVALQFAYQFPERIERLVLISAGGLGAEVAPMLADVLRGSADDQQRQSFLHTPRTVIDQREQTFWAGHQLGLLREVPLLVAWGTNDKTVPPDHHHALAKRLPHAVTAQIPDAGHLPHETAPAQLLSAIQTFLAATQPYRYVENRWVQLLSSAEPLKHRHDATYSQHGHAFSSDYPVRHRWPSQT
jgi:pimeloyl-ACP methyl ester carboxylesterase